MADKSTNKFEKNKLIAKAFFNVKFPPLSEVLKSKEVITSLALAIIFIILYVTFLYLKEKKYIQSLRCNEEYSPQEKEAKDKKLKEGPVDVYNEFKHVEQSLESSKSLEEASENSSQSPKNKNALALKVYRLNKDYSMTLKEINKVKERRERRNRRKNRNGKTPKELEEGKDEGEDDDEGGVGEEEDEKYKMVTAFERMDNRVTFDESNQKYTNRIVDDVTFGICNGQCLGL
eukprot:jgi/Orpsp1_1/1191865/evm.model.d7180000089015.1